MCIDVWYLVCVCVCVCVCACVCVCVMCVWCVCDVWCVMSHWCAWCNVWWEYREQNWSWGSERTEPILTPLDTTHTPWLELWVCALTCYLTCDVMWCVMWEYRQQYWRWGSKCTDSVPGTLDIPHTPWLELWVCALMCYLMCYMMCLMWYHIDVMCVSTGNGIEYKGAIALSQSLPNLTQLTHFDLSCECMYWCVWCDV